MMQAVEVPEKSDNEVHIILKREPRNANEPRYVTQQMFLQFSSIMQKGMQEMLDKMTHIQDLMVTIASNQRQEQQQDVRIINEALREEGQQQSNDDHYYPVIMQESVHSQEEVHMLEDEDEGTAEYIIDMDETQEHDTQDYVYRDATMKRRESTAPKNAPKLKRIKSEMIPIQNYIHDEAKQASDELVHIVESIAASENIQRNVNSEEVIDTSSYHESSNDPLEIKIQPTTKYEIISVTEELDFDFPLTSLDSLNKLNVVLANDDRMVEAMKHKLAEISTSVDFNFQKALQRLLSDNVMHQLNWQGLKGKIRMKDMTLFGQILYQAWFQHIEFEQYEDLLKVITKKAHKRYSKSLERKRHRVLGGPHRLVSEMTSNVKVEIKS